MRLSAARKVRAFFEGGGTVVAVGRLPLDSMENGRDDEALLREWETVFGPDLAEGLGTRGSRTLQAARQPVNTGNGRAFFAGDTRDLLMILDEHVPKDVEVLRGSPEHFYYLHRIKEGRHIYFFVNDSRERRRVAVSVPVVGRAERWDPETGGKESVHCVSKNGSSELHFSFEAWQAYYVVFEEGVDVQAWDVVDTNLDEYEIVEAGEGAVVIRGRAPLTEGTIRAEVTDGTKTYRGFRSVGALQPITLSGDWRFTPEDEIPVCYARMQTASQGEGETLGFHEPEYNDRSWAEEWLSKERFTIRDWWVIGPFDYKNHLGFHEPYPPEREIDLGAAYESRGGVTIGWQRYISPERIVSLRDALRLDDDSWATSYALSHVYSPQEHTVQLRVTADNNAKAWINGELVISEHDEPPYMEMRDAFGYRANVRLKAGWNSLLLKVSKAIWGRAGYAFVARFCDGDGQHIPELVYAAEPDGNQTSPQPERGTTLRERWYRLEVPAGASGLHMPKLRKTPDVFVDGERFAARESDEAVPILPDHAGRTMAIRLDAGEEIPDFLRFKAGPTGIALGSWSKTGLSYYAGTASYEKEFELPEAYLENRLMLDMESVGVVAEVWVNDRRVGERVWRPFVLDITSTVRPGTNRLRVAITNTHANERAGGARQEQVWLWGTTRGPGLLENIEENGLLGPVRLIPWIETDLRCTKQ
jgi:hypothetical protein